MWRRHFQFVRGESGSENGHRSKIFDRDEKLQFDRFVKVEKSNVIEYAKRIVRANRYDKGEFAAFP